MKRIVLFLLFSLAFPWVVPAAGNRPDSSSLRVSSCKAEQFRPSCLIAPGVLFAAGAAGVHWDFYRENISIPIKNYADGLRSSYGKIGLDDYLQYAPFLGYMTLGFAGPGTHSFGERVLAGGTAYAAMGILNNALKYTVCEMRPDGSRRNSFPSGHSATAFMGAELIRIEYGPWWGLGAYTAATTVALLRVYNCRHWFNDLLGGAAVGVLSAQVGYWLLPLERRLVDRIFGFSISSRPGHAGSIALLPFAAPTPAHASVGFSLALDF